MTFPHMGNAYIPIGGLLSKLNIDYLVPPPSSKKTLTLGAKYGPEFACLPLKVNLGNLIEARELGADTIFMIGGVGPCRFGLYAQLEKEILNEFGYNYEQLVVEPPEKHIGEFLSRVKKVIGNVSWWNMYQAVKFGYEKAKAVDELEKLVQYYRPREKVFGNVDLIYEQGLKNIDKASDTGQLQEAKGLTRQKLSHVPQMEDYQELKIGLVGEIYTLLEPFVNLDIEKELGKLGAVVTRSIYLSEWIEDHLFVSWMKHEKFDFKELAKPYLNSFVGGHGRETIGYTVGFCKENYDGIVQIAPLTCMPEIIAHGIMPKIKEDFGIPVLTIYLDEQSGKAGLVTRLEAFVDLIKRRKNCERRVLN